MTLPTGFEALEPFVARWAIQGTATRDALRSASSPEERRAFYDAAQPLLAAALAHLDAKLLNELDPKEHTLMNLMLSLAHVTIAVEIQREDEPGHAKARSHMHITRAVADA